MHVYQMNEWMKNKANSLVFSVLVVRVHWFLYNMMAVVTESYLLIAWPINLGPKHWAEGVGETFCWSILISEGFSKWSLADMTSLIRLGVPGVEKDMEWYIIHLTRSQASCVLIPLDEWFHTLLWISVFKHWKCILGIWAYFSGFLNFSLPRICSWSFFPLCICVFKMSVNNKKNHHLYLKSAKKLTGNRPAITTNKMHMR